MRMFYCRLTDARGNEWKVYIVDGWAKIEDEPRGHRRCYGVTDFDRREIELSIMQSWRTFKRTFMHEVGGHAALGVERPDDWDRRHEEKVMMRSEASLLRMMQQLGMRVPPLPEGVKLRPRKHSRKAAT